MPIDTSEAWVRWLVGASGLRLEPIYKEIARFTAEYDAGRLDIDEFMDYQMRFLAQFRRPFLERCRQVFVGEWMSSILPARSVELVKKHQDAGDVLVLCTATYRFVSSPIGELFGIHCNIACDAAQDERGEFLGRTTDGNSYGPSKVTRAEAFLKTPAARGLTAGDVVFYSDSTVDMPLFEYVEAAGGTCVAANASPDLRQIATARGWPMITTFDPVDEKRAYMPAAGVQCYPEIFHV